MLYMQKWHSIQLSLLLFVAILLHNFRWNAVYFNRKEWRSTVSRLCKYFYNLCKYWFLACEFHSKVNDPLNKFGFWISMENQISVFKKFVYIHDQSYCSVFLKKTLFNLRKGSENIFFSESVITICLAILQSFVICAVNYIGLTQRNE